MSTKEEALAEIDDVIARGFRNTTGAAFNAEDALGETFAVARNCWKEVRDLRGLPEGLRYAVMENSHAVMILCTVLRSLNKCK